MPNTPRTLPHARSLLPCLPSAAAVAHPKGSAASSPGFTPKDRRGSGLERHWRGRREKDLLRTHTAVSRYL